MPKKKILLYNNQLKQWKLTIKLTISDLCLTEIKALACTGLINFSDGNNEITSKTGCEIMAKHSISFVTMKKYMQVCSMCSQY